MIKWLGLISVALFVPVLILALRRSIRARATLRETYRAAADAMGWSHSEVDEDLVAPYRQLSLFNAGRAQTANDILRGTFGSHTATVFEFGYTMGSGRGSTRYVQTVVHVEAGAADLPHFEVRPRKGVADFVRRALSRTDVELVHQPSFGRRFVLTGPDHAGVRARFTEAVITAFDALPGMNVQGFGPHVFVYRPGDVMSPDKMPERLAAASGVLRAFEEE